MAEEQDVSEIIDAKIVEKILDQLSKSELFENCDKAEFKRIVERSKLVAFESYNIVWDDVHLGKLQFCLIIEGCIAVIYKDGDIKTVNAFLAPNQLFGEFEFLGFATRNLTLRAITPTKLLIPRIEDILSLAESEPKKFYENLAKTLVHKIIGQSHFINIRSRKLIVTRIASLLNKFTVDEEWNEFVRYPTNNYTNHYEIDVFWSTPLLEYCISSEHRSIAKAFETLLNDNVIEIKLFNEHFENETLLDAEYFRRSAKMGRKKVRDDNYIKITVLDYATMSTKYNL